MSETDDDFPTLGGNERDRSVAILRTVASYVPLAGNALAELITNVIPNQRIDRIERYIMLLARKLESLDAKALKAAIAVAENAALFEDGAIQAARAITEDRLKRISSCVANGFTESEINKLRSRRILALLGELDDEELAILEGFARVDGADLSKLRPPPAVMGGPPENLEANAMWDASLNKLERLSLLQFKQHIEKTGGFDGMPKFDIWGKRRGYYVVSPVGKRLLETVRDR